MCRWGQKTRNNDIKLLTNNPAALKAEPDCLTGEISWLRHILHHSAKSKVFLNEAARGDSPAPSLLRPASLFSFWTRMLVLLRCSASRPWFHFEVWSGALNFDVSGEGGEISIHGVCHDVGASLLFPCPRANPRPRQKSTSDMEDDLILIRVRPAAPRANSGAFKWFWTVGQSSSLVLIQICLSAAVFPAHASSTCLRLRVFVPSNNFLTAQNTDT